MKIAINGFGRIGRSVFRSVFEYDKADVEIVAINDLASIDSLAHFLQYDSVHGRFATPVEVNGDTLIVGGKKIRITAERDPANLDWDDVDVALECTGVFRSREKAELVLGSGASKVLISAPASGDGVKTVVYGVNHDTINGDDKIVSNASCTTNCLAPVAKVLDDNFGIETGYMTTIHAYTSSQPVHDVYKSDLYRARAGALSMIPTSTGAAKAIGLVLPHLKGKLDGSAIRIPTPNVSLVNLCVMLGKDCSVEDINAAMKAAAEGPMAGVLAYDTAPKVSIDYNHTTESSHYHAPQTDITEGGMFRILSWYDNEWGFSNRMIDTARVLAKA